MTPVPPDAPSRSTTRPARYGPLVLSLSTVPTLSRLIAHPASSRVFVPLVVGVVVADAVVALTRRRVGLFPAVALGAVVAATVLVVCVDPSVVNPSSPHFFAPGVLSGQLRAARGALVDGGTPLPLLSGVVVAIGALGAATAAVTRGVWAQSRRYVAGSGQVRMLAPGLTPSLALFVYSTLVSAEQGRIAAALSYFLGVGIFILLADRETADAGASSSPRPGFRRRPLAGAVAAGLLASAVVVGAGAGLSGMQVTVLHVHPPVASASVAPGELLTGLALVDNLRATEITDSHAVIFRATSPVPTYWQVGTLSTFDGSRWLPTAGVDTALSGSPGARVAPLSAATLPSPPATQTFSTAVAISDFASRLLPAPPHALAVHGLAGAVAVDEEGVLAATPSAPGTSYRVTARLATTSLPAGPQLSAGDPRLAPYLTLPAQPAVVSQLAHQAVGDARTPTAEAQALVDWFRSPHFRYTLSPPPTPGADPLVQFLTVTRAGYCQQFAGAFGVLARTLGIPTRLVAGFTVGQPGPAGTYTVTGADAHVWPQVYLGPAAGWVSVEPTPPAHGALMAQGLLGPVHRTQSVVGTSATTPTTAAAPTATSTPGTIPAASHPTTGSRGSGRGSRPHHHPRTTAPTSHGWELALVLALIVAALLIAATLVAREVRRRRRVREAALHPDQRVVRSWERALGALRRRGMPRQAGETPAEYADRVRSTGSASPQPDDADAVTRLAALVELACYDPRPCTPRDVAAAQHLASTIVTSNRRHARRPPAPVP